MTSELEVGLGLWQEEYRRVVADDVDRRGVTARILLAQALIEVSGLCSLKEAAGGYSGKRVCLLSHNTIFVF